MRLHAHFAPDAREKYLTVMRAHIRFMPRLCTYRYIVSEGVEILYDRKNDPWEMKNVAQQFPEITERMRNAVAAWMKSTGPVLPPKTY